MWGNEVDRENGELTEVTEPTMSYEDLNIVTSRLMRLYREKLWTSTGA